MEVIGRKEPAVTVTATGCSITNLSCDPRPHSITCHTSCGWPFAIREESSSVGSVVAFRSRFPAARCDRVKVTGGIVRLILLFILLASVSPAIAAAGDAPPASAQTPAQATPIILVPKSNNQWCHLGYFNPMKSWAELDPTDVTFKIEPDGSVEDVELVESSGDTAADRVFVQCVKGWRYEPIPHEVRWGTSTAWNGDVPAIPSGAPHVCPEYATSVARLPGAFHESVLLFVVSRNGVVSNVTTTQSSGDPEFDSQLEKCVSSWTYRLPTGHSLRPETLWEVSFLWSAATGLTVREHLPRGHRCSIGWMPERLIRQGVGGSIALKFVIRKNGSVDTVSITRSSGDAELDDAAKLCVSTWRYRPSVNNRGESFDTWSSAELKFSPGYAGHKS